MVEQVVKDMQKLVKKEDLLSSDIRTLYSYYISSNYDRRFLVQDLRYQIAKRIGL